MTIVWILFGIELLELGGLLFLMFVLSSNRPMPAPMRRLAKRVSTVEAKRREKKWLSERSMADRTIVAPTPPDARTRIKKARLRGRNMQ